MKNPSKLRVVAALRKRIKIGKKWNQICTNKNNFFPMFFVFSKYIYLFFITSVSWDQIFNRDGFFLNQTRKKNILFSRGSVSFRSVVTLSKANLVLLQRFPICLVEVQMMKTSWKKWWRQETLWEYKFSRKSRIFKIGVKRWLGLRQQCKSIPQQKKQKDPKSHQRIGNTLQVGIIARE